MTVSTTLQKINFALSWAAIVLTPIFFLPTTSEFYEFNKQALLIIIVAASLVLWAARFIVEKQVRLTRSPLGLPLAALALTWIISGMTQTPNRWDAFLEPGQAGSIVALVVLFFTSINAVHTKKQVESLATALTISITALGAMAILFASGLASQIVPVAFMKNALWSPTGNPFATLSVLIVGFIFTLLILLNSRKDTKGPKFILNVASLAVAFIGGSLLMYRLFLMPNNPNRPVFLTQSVSWSIALETLKTSPIFGTGPATFLSDFTRFRPISYNTTPNWAVRFASGSNYYLQLLTTVGILGFVAFLSVVLRVAQLTLKALRTSNESSLHSVVIASSLTALLTMVSFLFIPVSFTSLAVLFFMLIIAVSAFKLLGSSLVHEANIDIVAASDSGAKSPILPAVGFALSLLVVIPTLFFLGRAYLAEVHFQKALSHAATSDGKATYDALIQAYTTNPYKDSYRLAYSQTNLLLANSLAGKKDLTNEDRATIGSLIQQSIREAKNAVALNPQKVTNLENLANIYQSLIPLAKGADSWTVASYRQAILLDPANPNLRIALGGVLFQLKQYDQAIVLFQQAADLKPDLANAYYNLSAAYKEKKDFQNAAAAMQAVVNTVNKDSADYTKAVTELDELKKKLGEKTSATPSTSTEPAQTSLEAPKPLTSPKLNPQVELPKELAPAVTITPAPTTRPATSPTSAPTTAPTATPQP